MALKKTEITSSGRTLGQNNYIILTNPGQFHWEIRDVKGGELYPLVWIVALRILISFIKLFRERNKRTIFQGTR